MTIQTAAIATAPKQRTTRFITAAAGAVLALSAAAGIGAWQLSRDGSTSTGGQQAASMPAPATVQRVAGRVIDLAPTYYVVASEAQAATVYAALEEANAVRATSGEPTLAQHVAQLDSAEAEAQFLEGTSIADAIRATDGLPPVRVIDLRPTSETAARVPASDPAASSDQEMYSRWLQAQAAAVQVPDPAAFSDAEMYQRWHHAQAAPVGHRDVN